MTALAQLDASRHRRSSSGSPTEGRLRIENLTVRFVQDGLPAVEGISLAIEPGEFVALLGPSGCGKSTVLNAVAGFLQPTSGRILLDGKTVVEPSSQAAVVFQHHSLFPWMTAWQNVAFGPEMLNFPQAREVAWELLNAVGLSEHAHSYPAQLSGGMRQRVGLARALAVKPPILLMDEPFGALDALTRELMQELLLRVWEEHRSTVVFVTHDVDEAIFLADRVVVLGARPGRISQEFEVGFARQRQPEIRSDTRFLRLRQEIGRLIRAEGLRHFNSFRT